MYLPRMKCEHDSLSLWPKRLMPDPLQTAHTHAQGHASEQPRVRGILEHGRLSRLVDRLGGGDGLGEVLVEVLVDNRGDVVREPDIKVVHPDDVNLVDAGVRRTCVEGTSQLLAQQHEK